MQFECARIWVGTRGKNAGDDKVLFTLRSFLSTRYRPAWEFWGNWTHTREKITI